MTPSGWQIDGVVGFTKNSNAPNGTDPYTMYHWTQWSTTNTPATGNVLSAWVSYFSWDTLNNNTNATSYLNT